MTSKKIDINPALFGMKTRKNRGGKPNLSKMIAPTVNAVKTNLLKKIKEHRSKETKKKEDESKKTTVEPHLVDDSLLYDDFSDSMAYLTTLSQQKKVNDEKVNFESNRQKKLENKTLKRHDSSSLPHVYLEMPENLKEHVPELTRNIEPPIKLVKDPIPYSNLKHGAKPTYKEWTRRNTDQIQPVVISSTIQQSERESQLNLIRAKLKQKQELVNTKLKPAFPISDDVSNGKNVEQLKKQIQDVTRMHHRTIRRKHIIGKLKKKRSVGILLVDRDTRKQILTACKELKRKPMVEVKQYLREHNFIKIGSNAPNDVLRQMYESAVLSGEVRNNNVDVLMHNFIKGEDSTQ
jgi:hypothetical protein